jgi:meso-butanediol dehydrogenase / (S,S)-butanediol dehydrogenase / diacetyl reductase
MTGAVGKVAIITQRAKASGRAIALPLAHDGADVGIIDLNAHTAESVAEKARVLGRSICTARLAWIIWQVIAI